MLRRFEHKLILCSIGQLCVHSNLPGYSDQHLLRVMMGMKPPFHALRGVICPVYPLWFKWQCAVFCHRYITQCTFPNFGKTDQVWSSKTHASKGLNVDLEL